MSAVSPQEQILGIVNNHWQSCCVGAAAQLELADVLADGPLHVDLLAERTKTHGPSLYRLLRALESTGIFTQTSPRVFGNTPASDCLRRNLPGSNWAWIRFTLCSGAPVFEGWRGLMLLLENGRPGFDQVTGQNGWEHMQSNPETATIFNQAMRDLSTSISPAVAAAFDWSRYPVIADIGGGIGSQLSSILDAHPSCRGILFDQPQVVAEAPDDSRIERVGGDFFKDIPIQADAYVMRWLAARLVGRGIRCHSEQLEEGRETTRSRDVGGVGGPGNPRVRHGQVDGPEHAGDGDRAGAYGGRIPRVARAGRFRARGNRRHAVTAEHRHRQAGSLTGARALRTAHDAARPNRDGGRGHRETRL